MIILCPALILVIIGSSTASGAGFEPPPPRDMLWHIVSTCLDVHKEDYCKQCISPRTDSLCARERECEETTEVWQESADYVAIRDIKMCGCGKNFLHGLAIPRAKITGVEDPRRSEAIWNFAWTAAKTRVNQENGIALIVNPTGKRSQDQLHVHIVRLQPDFLRRIAGTQSARVRSLDNIWGNAATIAARLNLQDYGVLVTKLPDGDFLVLVEEKSPEKTYTLWKCP
jgi:CDP-diacylglycerol pyrophosphatase